MQIYIMRGLPGSGKSTWAKEKERLTRLSGLTAYTVSTDNLFIDDDGIYRFDVNKLGFYHGLTLKMYASFVSGQCLIRPDILIVDNTNLQAWEIAPYYALAQAYDHQVKIVQLTTPLNTCKQRNIHEVSSEVMDGMAKSMSAIPNHWEVEYIDG